MIRSPSGDTPWRNISSFTDLYGVTRIPTATHLFLKIPVEIHVELEHVLSFCTFRVEEILKPTRYQIKLDKNNKALNS
jgi:hypothetical protein